MSLQVIKQPLVNINGHLSKWNSVHQSIEFQLQRSDFGLTFRQKISGFVRLKIAGTIPSAVQVGHTLKFKTLNVVTTAKITQLIQPNIIVTDSTLAGTVYGGTVIFTESYKNYYVETEIFGVNDSNVYVSLGTSRNTPTPEGIVKINVQEWLRTQTEFENQFAYNVINKMIRGEGTRFNIRYRENYNGNTYGYSTLSSLNLFYWSNSAKQIQEAYGQNMGDYVPTLDNARTQKAKFQSVFKKPTYFPGYPFSMNFIYSDNLTSYQIIRKEKTFNLNGVEIAETSTNLLMSQRQNANRLMLKEGYTSNVKTIDLWLESGSLNPNDAFNNNGIFTPAVFNPFKPLESIFLPQQFER
jgi:hypothetical protein